MIREINSESFLILTFALNPSRSKVAKELDQIPELQGLSYRRDCKEENANIKLNTMYIRTLVCRQKLIDNYFARRNSNKNNKIH